MQITDSAHDKGVHYLKGSPVVRFWVLQVSVFFWYKEWSNITLIQSELNLFAQFIWVSRRSCFKSPRSTSPISKISCTAERPFNYSVRGKIWFGIALLVVNACPKIRIGVNNWMYWRLHITVFCLTCSALIRCTLSSATRLTKTFEYPVSWEHSLEAYFP